METNESNTAVVGRRVVQYVIDVFLIGVVGTALLALYLLTPTQDDGAIESGPAFWIITAVVVVGSIGWALYVWVFRPHSHNGQTFGMGLMSLQVVSVDGTPASRGQLLGRTLLLVVDVGATPLIGLISMLVSSKHQRIGDHAAKTIVRDV